MKLIEIIEDDDQRLESVVFKMLDIPEEVEDENAEKKEGKDDVSESQGTNQESGMTGSLDEDGEPFEY